jgi:hypothetical protein
VDGRHGAAGHDLVGLRDVGCGGTDHRDTRHVVTVASATDCAEMDLCAYTQPARRAPRDPSARRADGDREPDLGLHADPRRAEERRPSGGPLNDSTNPEGRRAPAGPAAPDVVADVPPRALKRDRRRRFLHDGGLGVARPCHVLHGVRDRPGVTSRADPRLYAPSGRAVHAADRPNAHGGRGPRGGPSAGVDL